MALHKKIINTHPPPPSRGRQGENEIRARFRWGPAQKMGGGGAGGAREAALPTGTSLSGSKTRTASPERKSWGFLCLNPPRSGQRLPLRFFLINLLLLPGERNPFNPRVFDTVPIPSLAENSPATPQQRGWGGPTLEGPPGASPRPPVQTSCHLTTPPAPSRDAGGPGSAEGKRWPSRSARLCRVSAARGYGDARSRDNVRI